VTFVQRRRACSGQPPQGGHRSFVTIDAKAFHAALQQVDQIATVATASIEHAAAGVEPVLAIVGHAAASRRSAIDRAAPGVPTHATVMRRVRTVLYAPRSSVLSPPIAKKWAQYARSPAAHRLPSRLPIE
jgi:hypothetical protein